MKALLLAAGLGSRLRPITDKIPKCLVPIKGKPLLEYWLEILQAQNIEEIIINTHYLSQQVDEFINHSKVANELQQENKLKIVYEPTLLGTAATIRENYLFLKNSKLLLIHADNWCRCNFTDFITYHNSERPTNTTMTMMTFETSKPSQCGIVELGQRGIVTHFHEKIENPPSNLANGAIYILEPEIIEWINQKIEVTDISRELLPKFINKIATWKNNNIHKDIGTIEMLELAQND